MYSQFMMHGQKNIKSLMMSLSDDTGVAAGRGWV